MVLVLSFIFPICLEKSETMDIEKNDNTRYDDVEEEYRAGVFKLGI